MADGTDTIVKALVVESPTRPSRAYPEKANDDGFRAAADTVPPPFDPEALWGVYERSAILRPCIEAMAVNAGGGFGFRLVPELDLASKDIDREIRMSLILEKLSDGLKPIVTEDEIRARRVEVELEAEIEKARLDIWFKHVAGTISFLELCLKRVRSQEITGNAYWEIVRDRNGEPARINHLPATSIRFTPFEDEEVEIQTPQRVSPISFRMFREKRRVRKYVQLAWGQAVVFYKTFGDTRIMSSKTGKFFPSVEALTAEEGEKARPATEVYHFDQLSTDQTDYGIPRWIGATLAVLGSRECEEANYLFWTNNAIPEVLITVAGGKPADDLQQKLENYLRERKGNEIRWSPFIIKAESGGSAAGAMAGSQAGSQPRINVVPLRTGNGDALGQKYEEMNARKVQQQWRLPDLLVGRSEEANKAQADAARDHAEEQVFIPERQLGDAVMNRILAAKGVRYWRFEFNGPKMTDPPVLITMLLQVCRMGIITPAEAREIAGPAFGRVFERFDHPWTRIPLEWFKAQMQPPPSAEELAAQEDARAASGEEEQEAVAEEPVDDATRKKVRTVNDVRRALKQPPLPSPAGDTFLKDFDKPEPNPGFGGPPGAGKPPPFGKPAKAKIVETVKALIETRDALQIAKAEIAERELAEARKAAARGGEPEVLEVPNDVWKTWFAEE